MGTCARNCSDKKIVPQKLYTVKSPDTDIIIIIPQESTMWLYPLLRHRDRRFVQETTAQDITITKSIRSFEIECIPARNLALGNSKRTDSSIIDGTTIASGEHIRKTKNQRL
jgi:hypothetical protein